MTGPAYTGSSFVTVPSPSHLIESRSADRATRPSDPVVRSQQASVRRPGHPFFPQRVSARVPCCTVQYCTCPVVTSYCTARYCTVVSGCIGHLGPHPPGHPCGASPCPSEDLGVSARLSCISPIFSFLLSFWFGLVWFGALASRPTHRHPRAGQDRTGHGRIPDRTRPDSHIIQYRRGRRGLRPPSLGVRRGRWRLRRARERLTDPRAQRSRPIACPSAGPVPPGGREGAWVSQPGWGDRREGARAGGGGQGAMERQGTERGAAHGGREGGGAQQRRATTRARQGNGA